MHIFILGLFGLCRQCREKQNEYEARGKAIFSDITNNASQFGITNLNDRACQGIINAIWCTPADLVSPDAQQTYLRLDQVGHVSAAVNKVYADYIYSLLSAPGQMSMLAETALKTRAGSGVVGTIQDQIFLGLRDRWSKPFNTWVMGDISSVSFDNSTGRPGIDGPARMVTAGWDYKFAPGLLAGTAFSAGASDFKFGTRPDGASLGGYDQEEWSISAYLAGKTQNVAFDVIGTWGKLHYDIDRAIPMGLATRHALGETAGTNWSLAGQAAYEWTWKGITHGPVVGLTYQQVSIGSFQEVGSVVPGAYYALSFAGQDRRSLVGALGWRASWDAGFFQPFAKAVWKHEFLDDSRSVTATLTNGYLPSVVGPLSYSLPAVDLGRDWASVTLGTELKFSESMSGVVSGTGAFGQEQASKYGLQVGLRIKY